MLLSNEKQKNKTKKPKQNKNKNKKKNKKLNIYDWNLTSSLRFMVEEILQ